MRMFLTFVSGVVPFQHGSVSSTHQFHMSQVQKQTQPQGLLLSGARIFGNKASGHHSPEHRQTTYAKQLRLISPLYGLSCFNRFMVTQYMAYDIFPTVAAACVEDFSSNRSNIYPILCGAFKLRPTMRAPLGDKTYLSPDFYFLPEQICSIQLIE